MNVKILAVYNVIDDISKLAELKQQISQKMVSLVQHVAKMSLCCEVISCFVIICCFSSASSLMC